MRTKTTINNPKVENRSIKPVVETRTWSQKSLLAAVKNQSIIIKMERMNNIDGVSGRELPQTYQITIGVHTCIILFYTNINHFKAPS